MFDVGFTEILLIGIVSLVVIGPERLPAVAKTAGRWIGKLQRFVKGVKTDLASELDSGDLKKLIGDQREQIDELRQMVSSAKKDFQSTTQSVVESTREGLQELETSVSEAKQEAAKIGEEPAGQSSGTDVEDIGSTSGEIKQETDTSGKSAAPTVLSKPSANTPDETPSKDQSSSADSPSLKRTGTTDTDNQ